jgi:hypothetical protein
MVACTVPVSAQDATTGTTIADTTGLRPAVPVQHMVAAAPVSTAPPNTTGAIDLEGKIRKSGAIAAQMARYEWLDKVADANPRVLAAICQHEKSARLLAQHRHIAELAEADHYLCRRITRFKRAAVMLVENPHCDKVIALDPEGIYYAIARDPHLARTLSSHRMFDQMVDQNPDLARVIMEHMR